MKVAIIGSRSLRNSADVLAKVIALVTWICEDQEFDGEHTIISGGAAGPDTWAVNHARQLDIPTVVHLPLWDTYGRMAGVLRNTKIADEADLVVAFNLGTAGTEDTIAQAQALRKPVIDRALHLDLVDLRDHLYAVLRADETRSDDPAA